MSGAALTRLDTVILRLEAQRAGLDWAVGAIAGLAGPVLELGLGNGRTYDHLRRRLAGSRDIWVFDRAVGAHPDSIPPAAFLVLGDLRETLPAFAARGVVKAALAHADLGSGDAVATAEFARWLGPVLAPLVAPGGLVLSDQPLAAAGLGMIAPPAGIPAGRYHVYRRA